MVGGETAQAKLSRVGGSAIFHLSASSTRRAWSGRHVACTGEPFRGYYVQLQKRQLLQSFNYGSRAPRRQGISAGITVDC